MALISTSRPSDQSIANLIAGEAISVTAKKPKKKVKATTWGFPSNAPDRSDEVEGANKGRRMRISDTSGNVTAGGPGSGRKKEIEDYLRENGWKRSDHPRFHGDETRASHWSKEIATNPHGHENPSWHVTHGVMVEPNGNWYHSVDGMHSGESLDSLRTLTIAASGGISGTSLNSLKKIFAKEFSQGKRKKLAKKHQAEPDGSYPIENKGDLKRAKQALGRSKNISKTRAWINKRAKELGAPKLGASESTLEKKTKLNKGKMIGGEDLNDGAPNSDTKIQFYSKRKKLKAGGPGSGPHVGDRVHLGFGKKGGAGFEGKVTKVEGNTVHIKNSEGRTFKGPMHLVTMKGLGEDNLNNKKINKWMEQQSASISVKANKGALRIVASKDGTRHIIVATHDRTERNKMHATMLKRGYKFKGNGKYVHANGDRVTMRFKAGGPGSGRKVGMALGNMLRQALIRRMSPAIDVAKKGTSMEKQAGRMMRQAVMNRMAPAIDIARKGSMTSSKLSLKKMKKLRIA